MVRKLGEQISLKICSSVCWNWMQDSLSSVYIQEAIGVIKECNTNILNP
jgi:hypothetical protein